MAIKQVRVAINGVWTTLTLDSTTGKYKGTIAAPSVTSYNVNSGHYYPVTVEAQNMALTTKTVTDTDATIGESLRLKVKEITKPTISFTAPTEAQFLATNKPTISFQLRDETNGSGVNIGSLSIKLDSTTFTNTSSGVTVTAVTGGYNVTLVPPTALSDGGHTVTVNVSDNDGNAATATSRSFTTDTVPPVLSITAPSDDNGWVAFAPYTISGTTSDATSGTPTVTISLNGKDQGAISVSSKGEFSKAVTLAEGVNSISVTATDKAGKTTTVTRTINLDTSVPEVTAVSITPNPVNINSSYVIEITVKG